MDDERLIKRELIWAPGTDQITKAQMKAIHTRHANAIRPIPSRTALGYDHLMADADRGALLAEVDRLSAQIAEAQQPLEGCDMCSCPSRRSTTHLICMECGIDYYHEPPQRLTSNGLTVLRAALAEVDRLRAEVPEEKS